MDVLDYITDNALMLIPALYIIGMMIKAIPKAPDWIIPFALLLLGVLGAFGLLGVSVDSAVQGVLCAGAAVYTNQLIKQGAEAAVSGK